MAACVGNAVEWYDFAIYGALGVLVTPVFFPSDDTATVLLAAFAVYATAFLVRPVGAVVFGVIADAQGRKPVLVAVVLLMSGATAGIGVLPGYAAVGVLASCVVLLLRITQGLAAGGELGLAAVFITESAPAGRRGAFAAWHTATLALGIAAGLTVGGLLHLLPPAQLEAGWWRIAFLIALPLGTVGFYLRRRVTESPAFLWESRGRRLEAHPVRLLWRQHRRAWLTGFAVIAAGSLAFNTFFIFLPNHLIATTDLAPSTVLLVAVIGLLGGAASALRLGSLSDRVGRRPVVLTSLGALALCFAAILAAGACYAGKYDVSYSGGTCHTIGDYGDHSWLCWSSRRLGRDRADRRLAARRTHWSGNRRLFGPDYSDVHLESGRRPQQPPS